MQINVLCFLVNSISLLPSSPSLQPLVPRDGHPFLLIGTAARDQQLQPNPRERGVRNRIQSHLKRWFYSGRQTPRCPVQTRRFGIHSRSGVAVSIAPPTFGEPGRVLRGEGGEDVGVRVHGHG